MDIITYVALVQPHTCTTPCVITCDSIYIHRCFKDVYPASGICQTVCCNFTCGWDVIHICFKSMATCSMWRCTDYSNFIYISQCGHWAHMLKVGDFQKWQTITYSKDIQLIVLQQTYLTLSFVGWMWFLCTVWNQMVFCWHLMETCRGKKCDNYNTKCIHISFNYHLYFTMCALYNCKHANIN